ncbi:MAG: translation elongation factor-like protein [Candidatus Sungbacteria bacterium]|nr:translation elongation factor-like protein [Candidatus Sungbacteria bacterium]
MEEKLGKIIHYFDKIGVGVIKLDTALKSGDTIHVKGKVSDFEQSVVSMQVDKKDVTSGKKGDEVAVKLDQPAKEGDGVFKK